MQSYINASFDSDVTITELAKAVGEAVGYQGSIGFDVSKPDGALCKWVNSSKLNRLGWQAKVGLNEGLAIAYAEMLKHP